MLTKPTAVIANKATKEIRNRLDKLDKDVAKFEGRVLDELVKLVRLLEEQQTLILSLKHNVSELRDNVNINRAIVTSNQNSLVGGIKKDSKRLAIKASITLFAMVALIKVFLF